MRARAHQQFCFYLPKDARRKVGRSYIIHRDHNNPLNGTPQKSNDPLGAVLTPEHDSVAFENLPRIELTCKLISTAKHLRVAPPHCPVASPSNVGHPWAVALEVVQVFQKRGPRHGSLSPRFKLSVRHP